METIKEFVERRQKEAEAAAGPEPTLEANFKETGQWISEMWIRWFMTRYNCSWILAQEEGMRRLKKKDPRLNLSNKRNSNKR